MPFKKFLELAARGGVVGGSLIMTNYVGVWGSVTDSENLLKRVKAQTAMSYTYTRNVRLKKTLDLVTLTPDVVANLVKTANHLTLKTILPKLTNIIHSVKIQIASDVNIIQEIQFPDEHGKDEHDENQQLKITENLPHVVPKALPQQEEEQCEAISAATFEQSNDEEDDDNNNDMGLILSALAMTLTIIKTNSSSSDIRKKFNS